ncbi:MAG: CBS domain-containing protein [Candidatus Latescibacteria bacterium]|jgi:CBS domain-containing protein|nr:CBS domain-containing protein [Candidatus Latescibacterota bacterium]
MNLTARDIMSHPVVSAREDMTVAELISLLREKQISGVPVIDSSEDLVGVISITDLLSISPDGLPRTDDEESDFHSSPAMDGLAGASALLEPEGEALDLIVRDLMSPNLISAGEGAPMGELADLMVTHRIHRLIIVEGRKAVGIVSVMDILRTLRDQHRAEG